MDGRVTGTGGRLRLASPTTALVLGLAVLLLAIAAVVVAGLSRQLTFSGFAAGAALTLACLGTGVVVARHQPRNPLGWLLLGTAMFFVLNDIASDYSVLDYRQHHGTLPLGPLAVLLQPSWAPAIVCFGLSILVFPDGRVPTGAWRWALVAFLAIGALWLGGAFAIAAGAILTHAVHVNPGGNLTVIENPTGGTAWWGYVQDVFFPALALSCLAWVARQFVALRRARGVRRLQLKWLIGGAVLSLLGLAASLTASNSHSGFVQAIGNLLGLGLVAFPISIGIAVLRYRMYEIDRLISRTLSYAILTALLVGTFVGLIALTTNTLAFSSRVGVAASTLAAAALFNPLRKRVQRLVDRRFNRARYDAEATVAAFTARLRDAVELDAIRADLLDAVNRAVQPTHASIWIKP